MTPKPMHALLPQDMVSLWELGHDRPAPERALALLSAGGQDSEELARLPLGACNARLLELRARTLGSELRCYAACPACGEAVEFSLSSTELAIAPVLGIGETATARLGPQADVVVRFRLPNSRDLAAAVATGDSARGAEVILERCVVQAEQAGEPVELAELSEAIRAEIGEAMAAADPGAEIRLRLACPACANDWSAPLEVSSFFWSELTVRAERLLLDVHRLARAYGWSENDILALSPARRSFYLSLVDP